MPSSFTILLISLDASHNQGSIEIIIYFINMSSKHCRCGNFMYLKFRAPKPIHVDPPLDAAVDSNSFSNSFHGQSVLGGVMGWWKSMKAVSEKAQGAFSPSALLMWQRELLDANNPPLVTCSHSHYDDKMAHNDSIIQKIEDATFSNLNIVQRSFFFCHADISLLRQRFLPPQLQSRLTTFEVLSACICQCRTIALHPNPPTNEVVGLLFAVSADNKFNPPLLIRYYGNALAFAKAQTHVEKLFGCPLSYITELLRKSKTDIIEEYMKSLVAFMALNGRPMVRLAGTFSHIRSKTRWI